jgi:pyridoxamine 5'-phosphate oxidase
MGCRTAASKPKPPPMTDPFALFDEWFASAGESELNDANAMALATADRSGHPDVRMVLLKGHGSEGFLFYTNEESAKGKQLQENPRATLLFHWKSLRRQVRVSGSVTKLSDATADAYFATRSRDSQLGAWASDQSRPLENRETFEERYEAAKARFDGKPVSRPPYWRGFALHPSQFEFWIDRPHRLHERRVFAKAADGRWSEGLLYP